MAAMCNWSNLFGQNLFGQNLSGRTDELKIPVESESRELDVTR
jgi:hypothetical protein